MGSQDRGLLVTAVEGDGPAALAGLILGDVLLALGGEPLEDTDQLLGALGPERIGAELSIRVLRAGAVLDLRITPRERA